jgi:hypothetical protein
VISPLHSHTCPSLRAAFALDARLCSPTLTSTVQLSSGVVVDHAQQGSLLVPVAHACASIPCPHSVLALRSIGAARMLATPWARPRSTGVLSRVSAACEWRETTERRAHRTSAAPAVAGEATVARVHPASGQRSQALRALLLRGPWLPMLGSSPGTTYAGLHSHPARRAPPFPWLS